MSNSSKYSLIDDDHIDDQETVNVGNLIIDLESDLEKEKFEHEQAISKTSTCTTTIGTSAANAPTSSTTSASATSLSSTTQAVAPASSLSSLPSSSSRAVFKSSTDERGDLKMRITRETKPGKSEHKIVSSPNRKSPTSSSNSSSGGNNNTQNNSCTALSQLFKHNDASLNDFNSGPSQSSSLTSNISSTRECGTSTSIGTITEPECLGPCEPGTSVTLEGIVWQETEGGILVVNVTWRGKTYVGALLDCTKHDWAPPRLCDSPASDIDLKSHKGVRAKRIVTRSNGIGVDEKNLLQTTGKLRNGKGRRILASSDPTTTCNKRQRESEKSSDNVAAQSEAGPSPATETSISASESVSVPQNVDTVSTNNESTMSTTSISGDKGPSSPMLIGCSEPNCSKKYRNLNGLLYHQTHAHGTDNETNNNPQDNNCSLNSRDKSKPMEVENQSEYQEEAVANDRVSCKSPPHKEAKFSDEKVDQPNRETRKTPSPQLTLKSRDRFPADLNMSNTTVSSLSGQDQKVPLVPRNSSQIERRNSSNSSLHITPNHDQSRRSPPGPSRHVQPLELIPGSSNLSSKQAPKQAHPPPPPLLATSEEGMKPSGTSTGPPPAPHSTNCFFNANNYLANFWNNPSTYGMGPYPYRPPLPPHMYDQLAPTSPAAALRLISNMRAPNPPPESSARLLPPSIPKNLPFPIYKVEPGSLPPLGPSNLLHNIPPLPITPHTSGSPHSRLPSQGDTMLPANPPPPLPPPQGLNGAFNLPSGAANPLGPAMGGPQVPSLVDDSKQFPRRFN